MKEEFHFLDLNTLSTCERDGVIKELIKQLIVLHDAGIIYNNLFYDNVNYI